MRLGFATPLMRIHLRNILILLALATAAGASWYFNRPPEPTATPARSSDIPRGYFLKDATLFGTDESGSVIYEIRAGRAEEMPDSNELSLERVEVRYTPETDVHWQLSATSGQAPADGTSLLLEGEVELESEPVEGRDSTVIRTQRLELDPNRYLASSTDPVIVSVGDGTLDAVGLRAYLKDDRLELESEIHGNFPP